MNISTTGIEIDKLSQYEYIARIRDCFCFLEEQSSLAPPDTTKYSTNGNQIQI